MTTVEYLKHAIEAKDVSATLYWLFYRAFYAVKEQLKVTTNNNTSSHYETETLGIKALLDMNYIDDNDAQTYRQVRQMFLLSEYGGKSFQWNEIVPYISAVDILCSKLPS